MLKALLAVLCAFGLTLLTIAPVFAVTPAAEKAFVDAYKKAIETSDKKTLQSFLYTEGAHPMALDFYKEVVLDGIGSKVTAIDLSDLTNEDKQKIANGKGPDGKPSKTNIPVVKKLTFKMESKSANGSSSSTSSVFIGEANGKLMIAVPAK